MARPSTLFEKIWDGHVVRDNGDGSVLLYVDRILLHEISSPQAFDALRRSGDRLNRPRSVIAVADHDVATLRRDQGIADERSRLQVETLARNCAEFGATHFAPEDPRHGITHVIAPELGAILPGSVAVACDSHATTYGAFGAIA
jgi:3-isopropylmalate/(R)-2-methylmalate dehydratase large subunit